MITTESRFVRAETAKVQRAARQLQRFNQRLEGMKKSDV
jgi:hypothetical protein